MEYKYLDVRNNPIKLRESEIAHKPTLDEILDFWINDRGNHTTNPDNWEKENERIKERFEEFKHYLEENKIEEPWIGLNELGMFPLRWVKLS